MKKFKKENGITLVALVITIILLLILAGISISQLAGSGLFEKAKKAEEESKKSQELETSILGDFENTTNECLIGKTLENVQTKTIKEAQENAMFKKDTNTIVQDIYGNKIVVPARFKVTNDATTVNQGIVIIDENQNEFVWIPVPSHGKVYTNLEKTEFKVVELNRYTFDGLGVKTAKNEDRIGDFRELQISDKGNKVTKSISEFKTSVIENEGYYIGRFEARKSSSNELTLKASDIIYNNVTQIIAADKCRNMYDDANPFTSDLMNSYAWDTATLFLQECGTNATYSRQIRISSILALTGTNNQTIKDVQCNIYDMAGNIFEWTTETDTHSSGSLPCSSRGGCYNNSFVYTSFRNNASTTTAEARTGFRPILYL